MNESDFSSRFSRTDSIRANLKQKSIHGAVFMAAGNTADILVRFGSIAILARLLLPEDFGLVFMVIALTSILDGLSYFGFSAATVQRPDISHRQVTNLFWVNVALGAIVAMTIAAAAPLIAAFYQDTRLVDIAIALSVVYFLNGLAVQHQALLARQLRQGELALIRLAAGIISAVIAIGLALNGWGLWSLVVRDIVRSALLAIGVWLRCQWLPGLPRKNVGTRSLIRFGSEMSLAWLVICLTHALDKLLIGRIFGAAPVGLYRQAQQLIMMPIEQLDGPITGVAQPALSALQNNPARYRRFYEKIVFIIGAVTVPLGLFITVCAEDITLLVLGQNWLDATVYVRIFGIFAVIRPAMGTSSIVVLTCGFSARYLTLAILHSVVLALLLFAAIPWGPEGMAIAFVGATFILIYPKLHFGFVGTPASVLGFFSALLAPFVSALVMLFGLLAVRNFAPTDDVVQSLALSTGVGGTVYLASMWLQPRARDEMRSLFTDLRTTFTTR